ncbi:MAG TPA: hypothetical protein VE715_18650 [Blastocatellia bacterium]|nr:hypothetical protein [Blastocatellia bacterium]
MITAYYKTALSAFVDSNGQRHFLLVTAPAANLARVFWVYSFKRTPGAFSLGLCHGEKASPSHVIDRLCEMTVFHHPAYVQIFNCDRVKTSYKIGRKLVVKILPTARHFQMCPGDYDSLFGASLRSLFLARKSPLLSLQIVQRVLEMARIFNLFAGRERGKTGNPDIHANGLSGRRQRLRFGYLANNQRIPAVNTARDPKLFALPFDRAGEPDAASSNTRNRESVALDRARSHLLVFLRESVIAVFTLESGEARLLAVLNAAKEAVESFVKTFERILLDCPQMAFHFRQRASFSQMTRLFDIAKRCAGDLITRDSLGKSGVVNMARVFKFALTGFYKVFVSTKSELESLDCGVFGISHCVSRFLRDAHWRGLASGCSFLSGHFIHTTNGQSIKQQNSERDALLTREIVLRSPAPAFAIRGGGSFIVPLGQIHSKENFRGTETLRRLTGMF